MKLRILSLITLILSITYFVSIPLVSAETQAKKTMLKPAFGDSDKDLPEGPSPGNKTDYKTFTFNLDLPSIKGNDYIQIIAELKEMTKYEGSCGNYTPDTLPRKDDLMFHKSDYPNKQGGWKYKKWDKLIFELHSNTKDRTVPTQVSVRCYDFGAYGKVTLTFKKKTGGVSWDSIDDTHAIPMDKNNNNIADGWEKDGTKNWKADKDDEHVPQGNFVNGDGWSVYDEYRGVFLKPTDTAITRLNPSAKDVMVCSETALASYGTGSVSIPHHVFHTIHPDWLM